MSTNFGPPISKKIYKLRMSKNLTQKELAQNLTNTAKEMGYDRNINAMSVCNWEKGMIPRPSTQKIIAKYFNTKVELLNMDLSDAISLFLSERDKYIELSKETLKRCSQIPVFVEVNEIEGYWAIYDNVNGKIISANFPPLSLDECTYKIFGMPNPITQYINITHGKKPLSKEGAILKASDKLIGVWLQPIRIPDKYAESLSGWYFYDASIDIFYKAGDVGSFPASCYGKTFICFDDPYK